MHWSTASTATEPKLIPIITTIKQETIFKTTTIAEAAKYMEENESLQTKLSQIKNKSFTEENISHEDIMEIKDQIRVL